MLASELQKHVVANSRRRNTFLMPDSSDFHSLRHTCGAWLALAGAHPKTVHSVMRHSTITLTLDTYGHLFPGQEAEAVSKPPDMLGEPSRNNGKKRGEHGRSKEK